jgi:hypothetical protein
LVESEDATALSFIQQRYPDFDSANSDPAMNTRFRIAARDAILPISDQPELTGSGASSRVERLTYIDSATGIAAWTDDSDVINICRDVLRSEAGIEIPKSSLVVRSLGYYLLILVPINYLVFRLMGRLEYAWLAVPVIAIGGAVWVARAARLDIGFARSQTEISLVEMQPNYQRGHLSRVVAIYNSLSSTYDVEFKTVDGAAVPVWGSGGSGSGQTAATFKTGYSEGPILSGLAVGSNQVRMLHAEQMIDMGGPIVLEADDRISNESSHELFDTFVVRKSTRGEVQLAMVGPFQSGATARLRFADVDEPVITDELPMQTGTLIRRLGTSAAIPRGSTRLIGRIEGSLPGMTISPNANQRASQTIVLAHLQHPPLPTATVDVNLIGDLQSVLTDDDQTESNR